MLTRLHVKGFKNLLDLDVRFGPFTCVAGSNGVGKSNLFDAIRFLNLLTRFPILEAVKLLRETKGRSPEPSTIFSCFENFRSSEVSFLAEMIVDRDVEDDFGVRAQAAISTLRYEVRFRLPSNGETGGPYREYRRSDHRLSRGPGAPANRIGSARGDCFIARHASCLTSPRDCSEAPQPRVITS